MLAKFIDEIIENYKEDPRNKVHIDEKTLLASCIEETGNDVTFEQLRIVISKYISGDMENEDQIIYDGAIYACSVAANNCFSDDPDGDGDVDYEIEWIENNDSSFTAEVRPN